MVFTNDGDGARGIFTCPMRYGAVLSSRKDWYLRAPANGNFVVSFRCVLSRKGSCLFPLNFYYSKYGEWKKFVFYFLISRAVLYYFREIRFSLFQLTCSRITFKFPGLHFSHSISCSSFSIGNIPSPLFSTTMGTHFSFHFTFTILFHVSLIPDVRYLVYRKIYNISSWKEMVKFAILRVRKKLKNIEIYLSIFFLLEGCKLSEPVFRNPIRPSNNIFVFIAARVSVPTSWRIRR